MARNRLNDLRRRVYQVLEQGSLGDGLSTWVDRALIMLIVVNLVAVALESIPRYGTRYATEFALIEYISLLVFRWSMPFDCGRRLSMGRTDISRACGRASNMRSAPPASST